MLLDLTNVQENGGGIPDGTHIVTCVEAAQKATKTGGEMIACKFKTASGLHIYHNFNTKNDSPKAVEIGLGQLKLFMRVAGKANPNALASTEELLGLTCAVTVKNKEDQNGTPRPNITSFKSVPKEHKSADPFA